MPSPPRDPESGERRPPADEFEWPPRAELWMHDVETGQWHVQQTAAGDPVAQQADTATRAPSNSAPPHERASDRRTPWLRSAGVAAALVLIAAGWVLYQGVRAPVPAEAAPPPGEGGDGGPGRAGRRRGHRAADHNQGHLARKAVRADAVPEPLSARR